MLFFSGLTVHGIIRALKVSPAAERGIKDFLDVLVALDLLRAKPNGTELLYTNSPESEAFLVKGAKRYIGDAFILSHDRYASQQACCPF